VLGPKRSEGKTPLITGKGPSVTRWDMEKNSVEKNAREKKGNLKKFGLRTGSGKPEIKK